jgi:hypothetical protein
VTTKTFESWAIVEIMGHKKFAGFVTEQSIGGLPFVRVDVPEIGELPAFTKFFGGMSIYCITPCTEETAIAFGRKLRERAFASYEAPRLSAPSSASELEFEDDEDDVPI